LLTGEDLGGMVSFIQIDEKDKRELYAHRDRVGNGKPK